MGCLKLSILDEQYKTEQNVSSHKKLTFTFYAENERRVLLYAYCANNPLKYVDPTGMSYDGYEDGNGNYQWFDNHTEASFTEGNTTWTKVTDNKQAWNEATTIRDAVVTGLVQLGNNEAEVKKDVGLFPANSPLFTKEAKLNNADKYTSGWDSKYNSETKTNEASQSSDISNTGYALKYYPTKGGMQNANAIGVVSSNSTAHLIEAGIEFIERAIFGTKADKDPISNMHGGNARGFLNRINGGYDKPVQSSGYTVPIYYQTGGRR